MEQSFAISEQMRLEAQAILAAHEQSAQEYLRHLDEPEPADCHPFESVPVGTTMRDLPDGGRLFTFSTGSFLRVMPGGEMVAIDEDGAPAVVAPSRAGKMTLPDGMELVLVAEAITVSYEAAGIEGLPHSVEPVMVSAGRYTVALPDGTRLDVSHVNRSVSVINPTGTVVVLGIARIQGIGEEVEVRAISGGAKSFRSLESGHAGMIESDGTIHLVLATGRDLVIRFPEGTADGGGNDGPALTCIDCEEPD